MSDIVRYSTDSTPNPIIDYLRSANTPDYENEPNVLINPDLSAVAGQPLKYWKHVAGSVQLMTQAERDAVDAAEVADLAASAKQSAKDAQDAQDANARLMRAIVKLTVDEINFLRARDRDRSADVAAATSLADLKTRWAARTALNDRTYAQAKTAIEALVDGE